MAIIAILAALMVPTFSGLEQRRVRFAIDQVEDLLTLYGYRDTTSTTSMKLERNERTGEIGLFVRQIDPEYPDAKPEWMPDRFMRPIVLPDFVELVDVRVDGRRYLPEAWSITRVPGEPRPLIELDFMGAELNFTLVLSPQSLSAQRIEHGRNDHGFRRPEDLDDSGRSREEW